MADMNTDTNTESIEYRGRTIVLTFVPEEIHYREDGSLSWSRGAHFDARVDGRHYATNTVAAKAVTSAKHGIDLVQENDEIYPTLVRIVGQVSPQEADAAPDASADTPVGAVVAFYSRGAHRRGLVVKVGKKNLELAYVTDGGLNEACYRRNGKAVVTRKSLPFAKVGVLS